MSRLLIRVIARGEGFDFWQIGDQVYRARTGEGLDRDGMPQAKRWESSLVMFKRFRAVFSWAQDVKEE